MITVDEAIRILSDTAPPREPVEVPLGQARGRVLAERVLADRDFPPTDRSAMDGYAVRAADVRGPSTRLVIVGEVPAGARAEGLRVGEGQAVRVFTGAVLPEGADAVAIVEHTREDQDGRAVRIEGPVGTGDHIRRRASDRTRGETVLEPGAPIGAAEIAVLASVGRVRVRVHRPVVIHLVSTGDELVEPHESPEPHQIRESNGPMLAAYLAARGHDVRIQRHAEDRSGALGRALGDGLAADLLVVSGGVSVGVYDLVASTLADLGAETLFHGVRMRPGKPILAARRGATLIVGLPGNPVSALVGLAVVVAPALRRMCGLARFEAPIVEAVLRAPLPAGSPRETFWLGRLAWSDGRLEAERVPATGSGDVLALARANGLIRVAANAERAEAGASVRVLPWDDPGLP